MRPRLMLTAVALLAWGTAGARSLYYSAWLQRYPSSPLAVSASCNICHLSSAGGDEKNPYGLSLQDRLLAGATIEQAIPLVEPDDSDTDHFSNLLEINLGYFPGSPGDSPANLVLDESPGTDTDFNADGVHDAADVAWLLAGHA